MRDPRQKRQPQTLPRGRDPTVWGGGVHCHGQKLRDSPRDFACVQEAVAWGNPAGLYPKNREHSHRGGDHFQLSSG